jgi:hypothetical protein
VVRGLIQAGFAVYLYELPEEQDDKSDFDSSARPKAASQIVQFQVSMLRMRSVALRSPFDHPVLWSLDSESVMSSLHRRPNQAIAFEQVSVPRNYADF